MEDFDKEEKEVEVYTDLETPVKVWVFKNVNRKVILDNSVVTSKDLEANQGLADILISKGLGDLICLK
jgi:hypothetical protein